MTAPRIALLFPGQASQYVGMGRALFEADPAAAAVFERVERASGVEVRRLCFEGPESELTLTPNLQPCLLAASVAAWTFASRRLPIEPACAAGHSVGEYAALVAAGALELEDAARLVRERGRLMQGAVPEGLGAMYALIGLEAEAIDQVLREIQRSGGRVWPANFNGGGQVVISGLARDLEQAVAALKAAGARKAIRLAVSAPFHSPLMQPAADGMRPFLTAVSFAPPRFPVYCNVNARPYPTMDQAAGLLVAQITSPVLWESSVRQMEADGVDVALELGAGAVLTKLMQRTSERIRPLSLDKPDDLAALREALG